MSMNLAFETVRGGHFVDFPFQTPTGLSYDVLNAKSVEERLKLIEVQMRDWKWDAELRKNLLRRIEVLLKDDTLRLIVV